MPQKAAVRHDHRQAIAVKLASQPQAATLALIDAGRADRAFHARCSNRAMQTLMCCAQLNRYIDAGTARKFVDFQRGVHLEGIENMVRPKSQRQFTAIRQRIHGEDLFRAAQGRQAHRQQTDRAQSDDSDRVSKADLRFADAVEGDEGWLEA